MVKHAQRIVVATHNAGKVKEIARIISDEMKKIDAHTEFEFVTSSQMNLPDPVEDGTTFAENALLKARDASARTGLPAMADDSGLIVDVMGAAPGILSARWAGKHGDDAANNALLVAQMSDIPDAVRTARFRCAAALVIPSELTDVNDGKPLEIVEVGEMTGRLLREPRGENGFGYDPLFVPDEQDGDLTSAEMSADQKNAISHRGKALRALAKHFEVLKN
ncbi:RdgB/HAM1 family non-canonical purine NTP pyrophosphatase [Alloscardovia venturai]|uniref:dITP/XTP pyrophosphatase n=1 Tax=Alloscardovia venturai TaxID=1769421 RepID=A0ABW2Y324_9BIFI